MDKIKDLNDQLTVELRNLQETYEDYKETHRLGLPKNDLLSKKFDFEYRKAHARINELLNTSGIEKQLSESKTLSRLFLGAFFPRIETVLRQEIRDRELLLSSMRANSKTLKFQSQNRTTDIPGALAIAFGRGLHSEGSRPRKKDTPRRKKAHFFDNATDRMELYKFMNRSFLEENPKAIEVIDSRLAETVDSSLSKLARRLVLLRDEFWNKCNLRKDHEFSMKFKANIEHSRKHVVNLANFAKTHPDHIFYMHKRINQTFLCFFNMQATLANLNNAEQRRCVSIMRDQLARDENKITKLAEKFCDFETKVVVDRNFSGRYWRDQFSKRRRTETAKVDENGEISDEDCEVEDATDDERSDEDNLDAQDDAKLTAEKMCQETDADVDALTALSGDEWDSPTSVADISEANHSKVQQMVEEVLEKKDIDFQEAQQELIRLGLECKAVKADELRAGENIGSGSFSIVRLTTIQSSIKRVAVKLVKPTARLPFSSLVNEAYLWGPLEHSNILKLEGYAVIERGIDKGPTLGLVSAECACGSLLSYVTNEGENLTLKKKFELLRDVAAGLKYLHERRPSKIIHGDLRAANILIDSRRNARLTDFGISSRYENGTKVCTPQIVTNVRWLAYELVDLPDESAGEKVNEQTDMFAFGCVMHEALTKLPPFDSDDDDDVMTAKRRRDLPPYPDRVHGDVWKAMVEFWNIDPETRPTAERAHIMMDKLAVNLPAS